MTSFFSKFKTRIGIWILVLTYSSGFLVLTPQLFTFIPAKPEPLFLTFNRKLEQNLMPQVQAEEVVGMTGTIVFNQTNELTGILSLAPGQDARWKSYIREGQRNPFNFTDPESLSARLTVGVFERYIIEKLSPVQRGWALAEMFRLPCFLGRDEDEIQISFSVHQIRDNGNHRMFGKV
jgi:hypothetical protein